MQIVIDIPEEIKKKRDEGKVLSSEEIATVCVAIKNGASLPKRHGDLIDKNKIKCSNCGKFGCENSDICATYHAQAIIKADGGDTE